MINWQILQQLDQLEQVDNLSNNQSVLLFKHSTRCSISSIAKQRLEKDWNLDEKNIIPFILDLISFRSISDEITTRYHVYHESPQILLISKSKCVLDLSHLDITYANILEQHQALV